MQFSDQELDKYSGDEIRRIRMVNYVSIITILTVVSYSVIYCFIDFFLFKPAIVFLLSTAIVFFIIVIINTLRYHKIAKVLVASVNPLSMAIISLIYFSKAPGFHVFLLLAAIIPVFLWSIKEKGILLFFILTDFTIYSVIEFFRPTIEHIIDLPDKYAEIFYSTNVVVCFMGAGFAVMVYLLLSNRKEEKLVQQTIELKKIQEQRDLIYSIITHDLRSSLNGQQQLSEIMLENYMTLSDSKRVSYIESINKSSKSLIKLFENLLEWSIYHSGKFQLNKANFDLSELLNDVSALMQENIKSKKINIIRNFSLSLKVNADYNMIATVTRNLLNNAIKYCNIGGEIEIKLSIKGNLAEVCIIDNGIGVAAKDLDRLFSFKEVFSTLGTNKEKGNGFGLKISKDFIEANSGTIWAESRENVGSRFCYSLPLVQ